MRRFVVVEAGLFALAVAALGSAEVVTVERRAEFEIQPWAEVDLSARADARVTYGGRVRAEGPIPIGSRTVPPADGFAQIDLTSYPGQTFNPTDPATWGRYAAFTLGVQREVGRFEARDQRVYTSLEARWSFITAVSRTDVPADRYLRAYALGITIGERSAKARLFVGYGRHEAAGPRRWGQWIVDGQVPLVRTSAPVLGDVRALLGGTAYLTVGPPAAGKQTTRDGLELHVSVLP